MHKSVTLTGFLAATSGTYMKTFDLALLSSYNPAFVTANGGTVGSAGSAFFGRPAGKT